MVGESVCLCRAHMEGAVWDLMKRHGKHWTGIFSYLNVVYKKSLETVTKALNLLADLLAMFDEASNIVLRFPDIAEVLAQVGCHG